MTKKEGKPHIRFVGFEENWKRYNLSEVVQIIMGQSPDGSTYSNIPSDYILVQGNADLENGWVKPRVWTTQITKQAEVGDLIMSVRAPAGAMGKTAYDVVIGRGVAAIKGNEFIYQLLVKMDKEGHWKQVCCGSTFESLNSDNIKNAEVLIPSNEEQKKIGDFLYNIDYLITLHQRKYDKLTNIKKSMLEKMFPKKGSDVPEIRFKGFSDNWEQRKVTEIAKIYIGLVTTMTKHYTDEGTLLIRNSDIKDGRFEFGDSPIYLEKSFAQKNESRMHQLGDIITVHTGDVGTSAVITQNEAKSIGFATIVTRPDSEIINSNYLCSFLNTDKHKKWAVGISTGDGRTNYNLGDYCELVVPVPSIKEQQKIAAFIQKVNDLITLHKYKLEKLKDIKKACIEKMFI